MADEKEDTGVQEDAATATDDAGESVLDDAVRKAKDQREEKCPFTVTEEKPLPKSKREITVEVPREEWERRIQEFFTDLKQNAAIEGFRKGKAPVKLLERRYMREAAKELVEKITPLIVRDYEAEKSLTLYGIPTITDYVWEGDKPVVVKIEVEVKPELDPQDYTGLEIEVPQIKMTDEMLNSRIDTLRTQSATFEEIDKEFTEKDAVVVDIKGVDAKGHTTMQETDKFFENPHDELPHEVSHAVFGKKAGETVEVSGHAGVRYTVTIKSVKELRLPEVDDEFAKDVGHESLAALRKSFEETINKELDTLNADEAFEVLTTKMVEAHNFEVPPALQKHVERDLAQSDYMYMAQTGLTPPRLSGKSRSEYREELEKNALNRVKGFLLIDAIGRKEKVEATEEDISAALEERAAREGRKPVAIRAALERRREFKQFTEQVRFDKIRNYLLGQTKVTYVEPKSAEPAKEGEEAPKE